MRRGFLKLKKSLKDFSPPFKRGQMLMNEKTCGPPPLTKCYLLPPSIYSMLTHLYFVLTFPSSLTPHFLSLPPSSLYGLSPDFLPPFSHPWALCSIGLISGMLLLLPFLALALMASSSPSPSSSSSDQSTSCCRFPLEPLVPLPLKN